MRVQPCDVARETYGPIVPDPLGTPAPPRGDVPQPDPPVLNNCVPDLWAVAAARARRAPAGDELRFWIPPLYV
jgi:hypothetical protein